MEEKKIKEIKEVYTELNDKNKVKMELLAVSLLKSQMIVDKEKPVNSQEAMKKK